MSVVVLPRVEGLKGLICRYISNYRNKGKRKNVFVYTVEWRCEQVDNNIDNESGLQSSKTITNPNCNYA